MYQRVDGLSALPERVQKGVPRAECVRNRRRQNIYRQYRRFVGIEENNERVELSIRSRFQNEGKDGYFLHYMLQKVFNVAILDLKHSTADGDAFDFAMYLFPYYLKRAIKQG